MKRVPRGAWACALVALFNALCWSLTTPPFQVPDEPDHYAYVKQLADTGQVPSVTSEGISIEVLAALNALGYYKIRQRPQVHTVASASEYATIMRELSALPPSIGSPSAGVATGQPPLYYALATIPYRLAGGSLLDRLQLMRLLSVMMAALTGMFVFLFVRETLPGEPWAWTVAGLSVALAPLFGFMSAGVNPDAMLIAVSAAAFYALARAFKRGFSAAGAAVIGLVTAIGLLTKLNFIGLVPGILFGLVALSLRARRESGRFPYGKLAIGCGLALSPAVIYLARGLLLNHPLGIASSVLYSAHASLPSELNYVWQFYLPRLPGMVNDFPGIFTTRELWFNGWVGLLGWLDTAFPGWVYDFALLPTAIIALLFGRTLLARRAVSRARAGEIITYAAMALGLMAIIAIAAYRVFPRHEAEFAQTRYLLPLVPILGAALALAARGAGRRWGPAVGTLIVVLFLAHDIFSQMLLVGRYYG